MWRSGWGGDACLKMMGGFHGAQFECSGGVCDRGLCVAAMILHLLFYFFSSCELLNFWVENLTRPTPNHRS